jgi:short-subunit dehydrogenase
MTVKSDQIMKIAGKVVVITGASAGVGRAIAHAFAKNGCKIALLARSEKALYEVKQEVEHLGGEGLVIPLDVADAYALEKAATYTEEMLGSIEIWINNAMNSVFSPVKEMKPEEYKRVTEVTYLGQVYGTLAALKKMLPRDKGKIIFVGSALAYRGIPLQSAYCASKHAIQGFFDSLRAELIHDKSNVQVTMVQLPAMDTTQFSWVKSRLPKKPKPMGKIFAPELAADALVYAAENNEREIFVGSPTVNAIIGNKILPALGDYYLGKTGYKGQQTNEPVEPGRKDNLWDTVEGKHKVHGGFSEFSHRYSISYWLGTHKGLALALFTIGAAAAITALIRD